MFISYFVFLFKRFYIYDLTHDPPTQFNITHLYAVCFRYTMFSIRIAQTGLYNLGFNGLQGITEALNIYHH